MLYKYLSLLPILSKSMDEMRQSSEIMFGVVTPIVIVIMIVGAIFGKKDK